MPTKAELRRHLLAQRAVLTLAEIEHKSALIAEYVCALPAFHVSHTVMRYMALPQEVQTMQSIAQARQLQKRVVVPVVNGDHLRPVGLSDDLAQVRGGRFGMLEPYDPQSVILPQEIGS